MSAGANLPAYLAPARAGQVALWRLAAGLALTAALYAGVLAALAAAVVALGRPGPEAALIVALAGFAPLAAGPLLAVRLLHRRAVGAVFGPAPAFWRDLVRTAGLAGLGLAGFSVLALPLGWPEAGLAPARWAVLLVPALAAIAVQTLAEEVLFRGYLMAQLAARFPASRALWLGGPALVFGLLHLDRTSFGAEAWAVVAVTTLFGLIAADLSLRAGNLGPAWGLHFANNVLALLVLGMPGPIDALALWVVPVAPGEGLLAYLAANAAALVALWAFLRRRTRGNRVKGSCGDEGCEEVVVPCGDFASHGDGVLTGGAPVEIVRHVVEGCEVGGGVCGSDAAVIVAEDHVHNPMQ